MSIRLLQSIFLAGVLSPVDGSTLSLGAALEADLVNQGKAVWVVRPTTANSGGRQEVLAYTNAFGGMSELIVGSDQNGLRSAGLPVPSVAATACGTYTGTGATLKVALGWRPKLVIVKGEAATKAVWVSRDTWYGRAGYFDATAFESTTLALTLTDDGFSVGTNANVNTGAAVYHYFAMRDDGNEAIITADYAGNTDNGRVLQLLAGRSIKAAIIKRDSTQFPVIAVAGKAAKKIDGNAATAVTINSDGTITVDNGADVNTWSGAAGEGTMLLGFVDKHPSVYIYTYTGTGAARTLQCPFDELEAFLILPRDSTAGSTGILWTSTLTAAGDLFLLGASAKLTGSSSVTSVLASRINLGTNNASNKSGSEFVLIAFRKNRATPAVVSVANHRPLRSTIGIMLDAAAYIDCGTSDTLKIDGAMTLEWFGNNLQNTASGWTLGAGANDETKQAPLIWRSSGADAVAGNVSFGMFMAPGYGSNVAHPGVFAVVTNFFDLPTSGGALDVDANQPWQAGSAVPISALSHIMLTHNGSGFWRLYVNGKLVKERDRDMLAAGTPRPNVAGGTGHRTVINGRQRAGGTPDHTGFKQMFRLARVYARQLSEAEVTQNYNSLFGDNTISAVADFVEEWVAANAVGSSLPATRYTANNGTMNGTYYIEGA